MTEFGTLMLQTFFKSNFFSVFKCKSNDVLQKIYLNLVPEFFF